MKEKNSRLFMDDTEFILRNNKEYDDFCSALSALYGKSRWNIDQKGTYNGRPTVLIFLPQDEVGKWVPKVGFVKNYVFNGLDVRFLPDKRFGRS